MTHTAYGGREGVEAFSIHQNLIDLVILDLSMPGLNGEETYKQLHAIDPEVSVIIASGYDRENIADQFAEYKIVDFLQKPFDVDRLSQQLRAIL